MGPLVPVIGAAVLGGAAWWRAKKKAYGKMTPERKKIFEQAMKSLSDPVKLRTLAKGYDTAGLKAEGDELRKRAALRDAPKKLQEERTTAFRKALTTTDPSKVKLVADAFQKIGAYGAAQKLRNYMKDLGATSIKTPTVSTAPEKTE